MEHFVQDASMQRFYSFMMRYDEEVVQDAKSRLQRAATSIPNPSQDHLKGTQSKNTKIDKVEFASKDKKTEEIDIDLHAQLKEKIDFLSHSIEKQRKKLDKIRKIMLTIEPKMCFTEGLKKQHEQEKQIYEYITTTIAEQEKQCQNLRIVLEGKLKVSETKRRAMELRGKAKIQKKHVVEKSGKHRSDKGPKIMFSKNSKPQNIPESVPESPIQPPIIPGTNSSFSEQNLPMLNRTSSLGDYCKKETGVSDERDDGGQQSLQRQLQQLQHQQDVLNAQGMALAAQGSISPGQLEVIRTLMQQQRALLSRQPEETSGLSTLHAAANSDAVALQQNHYYQQIMGILQSQGSISNPPSEDFQLDVATICAQAGKVLPHQILTQLQILQQQLQSQMKSLNEHNFQNDSHQSAEVAKVVMALQQLQEVQGLLLQGKYSSSSNSGTFQEDQSASMNSNGCAGHNSGDRNYRQPCQSPIEPALNPAFSPNSMSSRYENTEYGHQSSDRENQNVFQMMPAMSQPPSHLIDTNETRSNRMRNSQSTRPLVEQARYPVFQSPDRIGTYTQTSPLSGPLADQRGRNMLFEAHNRTQSDSSSHGTSDNGSKEKKLKNEDFYQYVNSLPGQTQQLIQLHQAQRMNIIRLQQQQLQALQQTQTEQVQQQHHEQEQQLQQIQLQQRQNQISQEQNYVVESSIQQEFISTDQLAPSLVGFRQHAHSTSGDSHSGSASSDHWQNELQADQVGTMSDMELFELLSGHATMGFTEDDEQVLDLLIAEGNDMLSI